MSDQTPALRSERVAMLMASLGFVACGVGIVTQRMLPLAPWNRFAESVAWVLAALLPSLLLHRLRGWAWAHTLILTVGCILVLLTGVLAAAAALVVALTGLAVGSLLVRQDRAIDAVIALPVGLAVIGGVVGWLVPFPVHHRWVYLAVASILCVWRVRVLFAALGALSRSWSAAVAAAPWFAVAAVVCLGLASSAAWLPTMQADDLSYHLGLPLQLQLNGVYALAPSLQIWTLAPWLGDVLQAIAQVMAGTEARGAINALWMLSGAAALACLTLRIGGSVRAAWIVVALFASEPLLASLIAGMQTELAATALVAAFALVVVLMPHERLATAAVALAGGLFALKFSHLVAAVALSIWALARVRFRTDPKRLGTAVVLFLIVAGSSYFYAWHVSGNPMLPLFNDIFKSPVMPARQLDNPLYHAGFGLSLPWQITFDTPRYFESDPGGFGFVLVAFLGLCLLALIQRDVRGLALTATAVTLLPLVPMQYARYAFPGAMLLMPPLVVTGIRVFGTRWFTGLALGVCLLNVIFQANTSWPLGTVARKRLLTHFGDRDYVLSRFAPERVLIARLRALDATDSVVFSLDVPYVAELAGRGRTASWYAPALDAAKKDADADASGERWKNLIDSTEAHWLLLRPERLNAAQRAALAKADSHPVAVVGQAALWSWNPAPAGATP